MLIFWNHSLIAVSVLVAIIGSFTALTHAERMRQSSGTSAFVWMTVGGITLGMAIWSMHFIGMLAFHLSIPLNYDLVLTLISAIPAILAALVGFYALRSPIIGMKRIVLASLVMGLGISAMHYTGMAALKMSPAIQYTPFIFVTSVLIAILASCGALLMMYRGEQIQLPRLARFALGSLVMGFAISGMHYTGMQGLNIAANSVCLATKAKVDHSVLAIIVTLASLFWFGGGILAALFDNRLARQNADALTKLQAAHDSLEESANALAATMLHDLQESEQKMHLVVDGALDCIVMMNTDGNIIEFNPAAEHTFGYQRQQVIGKSLAEVIVPKQHRVAHNAGMKHYNKTGLAKVVGKRLELTAIRADGVEFPIELAITAFKWGQEQIFAGFMRDITERKHSENEIHHLAFYDPLTKLPNRRLLRERIQHALLARTRHREYGAVIFIDLDNFKALNDTRGHDVGDLLLVEVAKRINTCVRSEDTVARLGGDEFVVILESLSEELGAALKDAEIVAEKIRHALSQHYLIEEMGHYTTPSIGICLFNDHAISADDLLKRADTAMYQAKQAGRNTIRFYDPAMQAALELRIKTENDLRLAVEKKQFQIYLQMQVDQANRICGAEALLRWQHPERGLVLPNDFIPLAEETGLIIPIGNWVLEMACAQLKAWENDTLTNQLTMAVNVSARQFRQPEFAEQLRKVIQGYGISAQKLKLELTESLVFDNAADAVEKMQELCEMGISFSMDDFGTGHSSMTYLKKMPLSQIKIDRSFVNDISVGRGDEVIVQTIIGMAHNLGMNVVAEGVETDEQLNFLREHGVMV